MSSAVEEDLSRVTIISPQRRVDLALPGSVTLGELLPSIVRFAGYEASNGTDAVHTWVLQRVGEDPLDPHRKVSALSIADGETLHLRQRENAMPDAAFDDVVDAVATSTMQRPSWGQKHSQRFALAALAALLLGVPAILLLKLFDASHVALVGAMITPAAGWQTQAEAGIGGLLAIACLIASISISRAAGEYRVASTFAWVAVVLAAMAGYGAMPASSTMPLRLLVAVSAVLVVSAAAALAAGVQVMPLFTAATTSALLLLAFACMAVWPDGVLAVCAVAITVMVGVTAMLPTFSYRIARIALPAVPPDAAAMMADETPVQADIVSRALMADRLLASFLTATALVSTLLALPLMMTRGWWALGLCLSVGLAMLLRARAFLGLQQRLALLTGGSLVTALAGTFALLRLQPAAQLAVAGVVLVLASIMLAYFATAMYNKIIAPTWGRTGDILEWLSIMTLVPMLLGVLHLYSKFRAMGG